MGFALDLDLGIELPCLDVEDRLDLLDVGHRVELLAGGLAGYEGMRRVVLDQFPDGLRLDLHGRWFLEVDLVHPDQVHVLRGEHRGMPAVRSAFSVRGAGRASRIALEFDRLREYRQARRLSSSRRTASSSDRAVPVVPVR